MNDLLKNLMGLSGIDAHENREPESYKRAPFGWPGGKSRSLPHLLPLLPYRDSFVETCGGSGVVSLNRKRSPLEVFNDRFSGVASFYICLQDRSKQEALSERLRHFVHSREMFVWAAETWENCTDVVERAARWFYTVKTSFGSIGVHWGRSTKCPSMIAQKLWEAISELGWVHHRVRHWQIENLDVIDCCKQYEHDGSVIYIDPDYLGTVRGHYRHEMDRRKHIQIIDTIFGGKGFYAVSGYANDLYDDPSWKWTARHTWRSFVSANADDCEGDRSREDAEEVLWIKDHQC